MKSNAQISTSKYVSAGIETTGDLRKFLANIAVGVAHGDIKIQEAAVAVKACEQINMSLYSEIKSRALQIQTGQKDTPNLGLLILSSPA